MIQGLIHLCIAVSVIGVAVFIAYNIGKKQK